MLILVPRASGVGCLTWDRRVDFIVLDVYLFVMEPLTPCGCCQLRAADKELQAPYTRLGATEVYAHMLRECFGIHVALSSEDSYGICSVCVSRLQDASDFKLQVLRTQAELQAGLQQEAHVKKEELIVESETEYGDVAGDEPVSALVGAAGADPEPAPSVSLRARQQLAMACCVRLARLRDSPRASQPCPAPPPATVQREPRTQPYTCDTCQAHFTHKSRLITHVQNHLSQKDERINRFVKHNEKKPHVCHVCNKEFTRKGSLKTHLVIHSEMKPYACKLCNKRFTQKGSLDIHASTHSGVKPYVCKVCNKGFANKREFDHS
ncbi:zinc finger and BTB domain-containing protein 49-like isoform X4 [Leguminivora glycinivorella]|uniref:zinc finger and BTB domain-containing protein 49-like isoform X4 n=1 Tax=Leguminivora glycinivorella TaxID=1035111 RepID=UPI002010B287|nr:zinc finger and BTB domain-containing protein 49-like isoform X4 [Leguminivora glycinivorella]